MTTLDGRARSAALAINNCVAEFTPAASFDVIAVRHQRWRTMRAGLAGAAAAAVVVLAGIAINQAPSPEVAEQPTTTIVATTQPPEPQIIAPVVPSTTEAPPTSTTATTAAPEPTTTTTEADTTPPPLSITSPQENEHFEIDVIEFRGTTEPGATVFAGRYEADVNDDGDWSIVLVLSPGANGAHFVATDVAGNETEASVTVYYDVPEPTTTTTTEAPKEEIKFTAYRVYGVCDSTPPYDVYWGTAPPGTPITITSDYGSGSTTANEKGDWEVKVYFPEAPGGTEFTVTVKDDKGQKYTFGFKYLI